MMPAGAIIAALLVASVSAQPGATEGQARGFGPKQCVHLTKSKTGSCVISLSCDGLDTSKTEFAFNCVTKHFVKRHSYGFGGFETNEKFDSEVKCDRCEAGHSAMPVNSFAPTIPGLQAPRVPMVTQKTAEPKKGEEAHYVSKRIAHVLPTHSSKAGSKFKHVHLHQHAVKHHHNKVRGATGFKAHLRATHNKVATEPKAEVVKYGPKDCVSTFKNSRGDCMVETQCKGVDVSKYEFGILCADKAGLKVHHIFGKGSFDEEERFDTLIPCDQCLSPEVSHQVFKVHAVKKAEATDKEEDKKDAKEEKKEDKEEAKEDKKEEKKEAKEEKKEEKKAAKEEKKEEKEDEKKDKKESTGSAASKLAPLAKEIEELTTAMEGISAAVGRLNAKVFKKKGPSPLAASPAGAPPAIKAGASYKGLSSDPAGPHQDSPSIPSGNGAKALEEDTSGATALHNVWVAKSQGKVRTAYVQEDGESEEAYAVRDDGDDEEDQQDEDKREVSRPAHKAQQEHKDDDEDGDSEEAYASDDVVAAVTAEPEKSSTSDAVAAALKEVEAGPFGLPVVSAPKVVAAADDDHAGPMGLPVAAVQTESTHSDAASKEGEDADDDEDTEAAVAAKEENDHQDSSDDVTDKDTAEEAEEKTKREEKTEDEDAGESEDSEDDPSLGN